MAVAVLTYANRAKVAEALTRGGYPVTRMTVNRWAAGAEMPAIAARMVIELFEHTPGTTKEAAPPIWAERLQASIEAVYERQTTIIDRQGTVGQEMAGKVIEALASPAQHEWAERIAARLDAPPTQSSEASDDRPGTEAPGAGTPAGRVPE